MEQQTPQQYENPRHKALAELNKAHAERVAPELTPIPGAPAVEFEPAPTVEPIKAEPSAPPTEGKTVPENTDAGSPEPAGESAPQQAEQQPRGEHGHFAPKTPAPEMVTVKIDGQESQITKSEVDEYGGVKGYQIAKAAEKRLHELNEARQTTNAHNAELARLIQLQRQPAQPAAPQPNPDEGLIRSVNVLRTSENEQEVLQAVKSLTQPATIPAQQIAQLVNAQFAWKEVNTAEKAFVDRIKDVLYEPDGSTLNPMVYEFAKSRDQMLRNAVIQSGQFPPDPAKFYQELEADIRKRVGKPAVAADLSARNAVKANIVQPRPAAGRAPAPEEAKPKTVEQLVDQQREARGQKKLYH